MSEIDDRDTNLEASDRGRQNHFDGYAFEDRVAEIYRLMHYEVVHGRLFSGRQVDLFLTTKVGDLTIHRAIECKGGTVKAEDIDIFVAKLRLVRLEYPQAQGTIIGGTGFTNAVSSHAAAEGIQLTLYQDLAAQLLDGHTYATNLIKDSRTSQRYPMKLYVEPLIGYEAVGPALHAFKLIDEWLDDSEWNQLTLLGDVGTGKSFLSRMTSHRLAVKFLQNPVKNPLPILIDLRNAERQFSLEGLILTHFAQNSLGRVSFDVFQHSLATGNIILILDGFDEMAARVTRQVTNRNFHELMRCVQGRAKVLLTCRTHYFKSRTEEEEIVLGGRQDYASETARDLYWELISRKGFRIAYLRPFEISQIEEYVRRAKPSTSKQALEKIRDTYNLIELSQRPMLLEMIVKSIDALNATEINATTLYEVFTDAWIHRDKWRDVLAPEEKLSFLTVLARLLWVEDTSNIHYSRLYDYLHDQLSKHIQDERVFIEIDNEIRTASFLVRDDNGNYGFAHKSYAEYFLARYLASQLRINPHRREWLRTRRLTPEVVSFLRNMVDVSTVEPYLEQLLTGEYESLVSENALLCLYGFRRSALLSGHYELDQDSEGLIIPLPDAVNLQGAQLEQITLEGARLRGAYLSGANLTEAILTRVDIQGAELSGARLEKANLSNATLCGAELNSATLNGCNFENANLSRADLQLADLNDCFLIGANLENTILVGANLKGAALSEVIKLKIDLGPTVDSLKSSFEAGDISIADQYWGIIEHYYPEMIRVARLFSIMQDVEPEDVVSELVIILMSPQHIERLVAMEDDDQWEYLYDALKKTASSLALDRDRAFGKGIKIDDDDEILVPDEEDLYDLEPDEEDLILQEKEEEEVEAEYVERLDRQATVYSEDDEKDKKVEITDVGPYFDIVARSTLGPLENVLTYEMQKILSPQLWRLVEAKYIYGYSLEEIARSENVASVNVQRQLTKAKEILRREFRQ